jgi:hypothetical protein
MKLVTMETTNRMAERLAAWHYRGSQKHGQRTLSHPKTRGGLGNDEGGRQRTIAVARSYAAFFDVPVFDAVIRFDVARALEGPRGWRVDLYFELR